MHVDICNMHVDICNMHVGICDIHVYICNMHVAGTTEPARSTCILCAARLNSTAAHFSTQTRLPDMLVGLECLGSLVNSDCFLELRSSPNVGPFLEGRNITCIHSKRVRSRLDTGDPATFADSHFGWTCDLHAPPQACYHS
jgi:hypothetical protein